MCVTATAPPFAYFGGKTTLAPRIAALLPEHRHYVEPFAGSLAVLLAKRPAPMETVNDLDGDLMTFWRVLRERPDELARACALTPHSRAEHEQSHHRPETLAELERARRVWVRLTQGRGGMLRRTGWRHYGDPHGGSGMPDYLEGYTARLLPAAHRLRHVTLECRPALDVIERFGRHPEVLIYADPPYLQCELRTEPEHRDLAAALRACRCAIVVSGYASPLYDDLFGDWNRQSIATATGNGVAGGQGRTEVLWSNRDIELTPGLWETSG
jgi:DNA adenine methylase